MVDDVEVLDPHRDPMVSRESGRDPDLYVVVRDDEAAVFERQARLAGPIWDGRNLRENPAPISRNRMPRSRTEIRSTLSRMPAHPCPADPSMGTRAGASAATTAGTRDSRRSRRPTRRGIRRSCRLRSTHGAARGDSVDEPRGSRRACKGAASPEHPIAGVLQRQMEVRREPAAARRHEIDDRRGAVHRLERADSEDDVGVGPHRVREANRRASARARSRPDPEVDPGEGDFPESGGGDPCDLSDDLPTGRLRPGATRKRDDAIGAVLLAAGLHAQRIPRPTREPRLDCRRRRDRRRPDARSGSGLRLTRRRPGVLLSSFRTTRRTVRQRRDVALRIASHSSRSRSNMSPGCLSAMRRIVWRAP